MTITVMQHRGVVQRYESRRGIAHILLDSGRAVELSIVAIGGSNRYPEAGDVLDVGLKDGLAVIGWYARDSPKLPRRLCRLPERSGSISRTRDMDANKRLELLKIGYSIQGTCGICKHGSFPNDSFGTCAIHDYQHLKHTGDRRQLSIYAYGRCDNFELDDRKARLGLWQEFLK